MAVKSLVEILSERVYTTLSDINIKITGDDTIIGHLRVLKQIFRK
jgi:hypothetical protein